MSAFQPRSLMPLQWALLKIASTQARQPAGPNSARRSARAFRFAGFSLRTAGRTWAGLPCFVAAAMAFQSSMASSTIFDVTPALTATAGTLSAASGSSL